MLQLEYQRYFSNKSTSIYKNRKDESKLIPKEYVNDSVINAYALALFANEFYPINYKQIPKDAFERIFCVGKNFKKYEKAIGPTPIQTDLIKAVPKNKIDELLQKQAIKRFGEFDDVKNVIDFFMDKKSDFITGQIIYLGGVSN
ncbi:hypothetical protein LMG8286_01615 [Campylobacter suis]|uniref:Uncharacterized protein n=1 Tax=Campylobacter suis TaxID=2790657 RepID=A0ABN7KC43_9BACT|nr:hypothetical protein LMG8286_01615 [Campylobacter suis]